MIPPKEYELACHYHRELLRWTKRERLVRALRTSNSPGHTQLFRFARWVARRVTIDEPLFGEKKGVFHEPPF